MPIGRESVIDRRGESVLTRRQRGYLGTYFDIIRVRLSGQASGIRTGEGRLDGGHDGRVGVMCGRATSKIIFADFVHPISTSQPAATNVEIAFERAASLKHAVIMRFVHVVGRVPYVEVLAAAGRTQPILGIVRVEKRIRRSTGAGGEEAKRCDEDRTCRQEGDLPPGKSEHRV